MLWLWHRPTAAAPIQPLAWEPPYVTGVALKSKEKKKKPDLIHGQHSVKKIAVTYRAFHIVIIKIVIINILDAGLWDGGP